MQYAFLIYLDEKAFKSKSKDEQNRVHAACGDWHDELMRTGKATGCAGLQSVTTATTLRERDGKQVVTDGPFAETKEVLGGFEMVECANLDEALAIARKFPGLEAGCAIEVRPCVPNNQCEAV